MSDEHAGTGGEAGPRRRRRRHRGRPEGAPAAPGNGAAAGDRAQRPLDPQRRADGGPRPGGPRRDGPHPDPRRPELRPNGGPAPAGAASRPDDRGPRPGGARRHGRGRRRDERGHGRDDAAAHADAPRGPESTLPTRAVLDDSKSAEAPLSPAEKAALREHFAFIAKYRRDFRVRTNDAEDLLITGVREPDDRGVCQHLLGKFDRALVAATMARVPDAARRTKILAGVVRFSRDVAILIQFLESLTASASPEQAAVTLAAALPEIDYGAVSPAQMRRVLELCAAVLPELERPTAVLGLLRSPSFRQAYDGASDTLPEALAGLFGPMRAVHAVLFESGDAPDPDLLARGVRVLLAGPPMHVERLPEEPRARLLAAALEVSGQSPDVERAVTALLRAMPKDSRRYSQLAIRRARQLIGAARDAEAKALLEELCQHHPDFKLPARWLSALSASKVGRLALFESREGGGLQRAFALEQLAPVWGVVGAPGDAEAFARAAALHADLVLPGVLPLVASGAGADGTPYLAVTQHGEPLPRALGAFRRGDRHLPAALRSAVELAAALGLAGVTLPDASLDRFVVDREDRLSLVTLVGCGSGAPAGADVTLASARALCEALAAAAATGATRRSVTRALAETTLAALARALVTV